MTNNVRKKLLVGLGHKARQGKDTAAEYLEKKYGCKIIHFADFLYEECRTGKLYYSKSKNTCYILPKDEEMFEMANPPQNFIDWFLEKGEEKSGLAYGADLYYGGMTDKDGVLLQFWGTEFRRKNFDWNYWVDKVEAILLADPYTEYMLPDARFKNEAEMVKKLGGTLWKVVRPGWVAQDRDPNHQSEIDLDDWEFDAILMNDGTIPELWEKAEIEYLKLKG